VNGDVDAVADGFARVGIATSDPPHLLAAKRRRVAARTLPHRRIDADLEGRKTLRRLLDTCRPFGELALVLQVAEDATLGLAAFPAQYSEESTLVYLAPESVLDPRGRDPMADVFSLALRQSGDMPRSHRSTPPLDVIRRGWLG
jgi:hypothetical protein